MGIEVALPSFLFRFPLLLCITFHLSCQDWGFVHQAIPLQLWQIPAYMYTPLFSHLFMVCIYQVCHDFFLVANCWYSKSQFLAIANFYSGKDMGKINRKRVRFKVGYFKF